MNEWLTGVAAGPAVLVTVAAVEGSGPREPGAKMLVGAAQLYGTIGGGHLEHKAIALARQMLAQGVGEEGAQRRYERYALGPSLGQCCGGVVYLAFERADAAQADVLRARPRVTTWRLIALDRAPDAILLDETLAPLGTGVGSGTGVRPLLGEPGPDPSADRSAGDAQRAALVFDPALGTHVATEPDGRRWLIDRIEPPHAHLVLFGAGHVGAAIVRALAELPCTVTWVDEREDMFPADVPSNVTIEATDTPECVVATAPPGAAYLVMTHSHALDQRLTEAILGRAHVGWFGLIGSKTKRAQFEHRLRARGVNDDTIATMVCPIGIPGIQSKLPAVIAASVAAQLLAVWEEQERQEQSLETGAPPIRLVASRRN
ncbi:xanthine dehydrogenase accessory protein XdhC [Massilia arenosa]|uniref:Xanthine dehydrogenase accessory protein XdhC n=1 Tax=Zemynaea arenosa TaxID=2561931 RepID=A0A4Y9SCN5_9BURK|nr:xanthine dehydrogenase accessory protein XdhC [Massilia arenosa]TFW18474.1 xanthine dehydrogenase accessory protein XdhC [Massilia arenosa]